jgi:hypothetical protein
MDETVTSGPTPQDADRPSLMEWQQRLAASKGYRAVALMDRIKRIGYMLQGNVSQYLGLVARLQDPAFSLPIMDVRNPDAHDNLLAEAERLLHNVLTAMSTRIDQQRVFMRKYLADDADLTRVYGEKVRTDFAGPQVAFLKELRNHMTHHQLPVAQSRQSFTLQSVEITFTLPCDALLAWEWSGGVRQWISGQNGDVMIVEVVSSYAHTAAAFDAWLAEQIRLKHAAEIGDFLKAQAEYTREYDRVFGF